MSGLAGCFFTGEVGCVEPARSGLASTFAGLNRDPQSYVDGDVALFVASHSARAGFSGSFAELIESDQYVLALEGYILNLLDLVGAGDRDAQSSRGEVLLKIFARHGAAIAEKLNGGYNFVIWNKSEKIATVSNCKFGQRNLYTIPTGGGITIASDLQALKQLSGKAFELNSDTACMSFLYGGVYGSATPLKNVTKVLPGSTLIVRAGSVTECFARDIPKAHTSSVRREKGFYVNQLDTLMRQAASRLGSAADTHAVMVGSGVDSSLVAAYGKGEIKNLVAVTQQMPGDLDESKEAARMVKALGIPHKIVSYEPLAGDLLKEISAFVRIVEEPAYWNQLGPPLLHLLGSLRDLPQSFLTGAEGDLLFYFRSPRRASLAQIIRNGLFWPVADYTARRLVNRVTRHTYIVGSDFDLLDRSLMRRHITVDCTAWESEPGFYNPSYAHLEAGPNAQRHFINNGWQNVRIISQLAREVGCEVFFPYLDDDVVSCVLSLPDEMKINKILLRILLAKFLSPDAVPTKKKGYWAHTIKWHYEIGALEGVLDLMSQRKTIERGVYNPQALRALIDAYASKVAQPRFHPVLWQLLVFETFCREFVDGK
ncbi:MAG: asparagine synthase-related protein [Pyrinomonadaceae bacterium]